MVKKEHERTFAGKVRRVLWLFIRRNFSARGLSLRFLAGRISFVDGRNNEARAIVLQIPGQTDPCTAHSIKESPAGLPLRVTP